MSKKLTLIAIPFLSLSIIAYLWYTTKVPRAREHERRLYDSVAEGMRSIIEGISVIKNFHAEGLYSRFFKNRVNEWRKDAIKIVKYERIY